MNKEEFQILARAVSEDEEAARTVAFYERLNELHNKYPDTNNLDLFNFLIRNSRVYKKIRKLFNYYFKRY
jgi:hypothetical protein